MHGEAAVDAGAELAGPFYVGPGCRVAAGARVGPGAVLTSSVTLAAQASVRDSVIWPGSEIGESAAVEGALLGARVRAGSCARIGPGAVLRCEIVGRHEAGARDRRVDAPQDQAGEGPSPASHAPVRTRGSTA